MWGDARALLDMVVHSPLPRIPFTEWQSSDQDAFLHVLAASDDPSTLRALLEVLATTTSSREALRVSMPLQAVLGGGSVHLVRAALVAGVVALPCVEVALAHNTPEVIAALARAVEHGDELRAGLREDALAAWDAGQNTNWFRAARDLGPVPPPDAAAAAGDGIAWPDVRGIASGLRPLEFLVSEASPSSAEKVLRAVLAQGADVTLASPTLVRDALRRGLASLVPPLIAAGAPATRDDLRAVDRALESAPRRATRHSLVAAGGAIACSLFPETSLVEDALRCGSVERTIHALGAAGVHRGDTRAAQEVLAAVTPAIVACPTFDVLELLYTAYGWRPSTEVILDLLDAHAVYDPDAAATQSTSDSDDDELFILRLLVLLYGRAGNRKTRMHDVLATAPSLRPFVMTYLMVVTEGAAAAVTASVPAMASMLLCGPERLVCGEDQSLGAVLRAQRLYIAWIHSFFAHVLVQTMASVQPALYPLDCAIMDDGRFVVDHAALGAFVRARGPRAVIGVYLSLVEPVGLYAKQGAHATAMFLNLARNCIEHYDPNGRSGNPERDDTYLARALTTEFARYFPPDTPPTFLSTGHACPKGTSCQSIATYDIRSGEWTTRREKAVASFLPVMGVGYDVPGTKVVSIPPSLGRNNPGACSLWTLLFANARLTNADLPFADVHALVLSSVEVTGFVNIQRQFAMQLLSQLQLLTNRASDICVVGQRHCWKSDALGPETYVTARRYATAQAP